MTAIVFVPDQPAARVHAALRHSLATMDEARRCAVLWFGDVMRRRLYQELGYSSINQYAMRGLGFSRTRTGDFIRLAQQLESLPAVRQAVASGSIGYTKARELVKVATPATEDLWLTAARRRTREDLQSAVKQAKRAAAVDSAQGELLPCAEPPVVAPRELPIHHQIDFTPEQEARRAALVERLHKLGGGMPSNRAELYLEALAALVETEEAKEQNTTPRYAPRGAPPVQIHVHEDAATGTMTVPTNTGERELSRAEAARMRCDAAVSTPGKRNTTTIPPRTRREILARDHHRCQAPGCGRTRFLEVHHLKPRRRGGTNHPTNLTTLCGACHRLYHERA